MVNVKKLTGNVFILAALSTIWTAYYTFVIQIYMPRGIELWSTRLILWVFHVLFVMLVWSFIQAILTDPGKVPPYWGFYMNDSEQKRKRYCLMWHVFKPERCHHCSTCNRCVLNMDHHCPWINNCVGFNNRKIFLLLLLYVLSCVYYILLFGAYPIYEIIVYLVTTSQDVQLLPQLQIVGVYAFLTIFSLVLTAFVRFHIGLLMKNSTTIESMDKKMKGYPFDVGTSLNLLQVFGKNRWLWALPVYGQSGKPVGGGVNWNKQLRHSEQLDDEIPNDSEQNRAVVPDQRIVVDTPKSNQAPGVASKKFDIPDADKSVKSEQLSQPSVFDSNRPMQHQEGDMKKLSDRLDSGPASLGSSLRSKELSSKRNS